MISCLMELGAGQIFTRNLRCVSGYRAFTPIYAEIEGSDEFKTEIEAASGRVIFDRVFTMLYIGTNKR